MNPKNSLRCGIVLTLLLLLFGCSSPAATPSSKDPWPTRDWTTSTPAAQGMDADLLEDMLAHVEESHLNLHGLLVIRHGVIVLEEYFAGHNRNERHAQYSVTKSFTSTLTGIAIDQGKLASEEILVKDFIPPDSYANPDPRKEAFTLENLLTMTTGLDWVEGDSSYAQLYMSDDWVKWMMSLPQAAEPGSVFNYCSGCSHVILRVVEKAAGEDVVDYARKNLFQPLGIKNFRWERNPQDEAIGGWGLMLTARDMAKLGYLYLHGGQWDGNQVVSNAWVEKATTGHIDAGAGMEYGYQWWIYPTRHAYAALGRYGQTIFVLPELDTVVVTTAEISNHDPVLDLIDRYIVPAVLEP